MWFAVTSKYQTAMRALTKVKWHNVHISIIAGTMFAVVLDRAFTEMSATQVRLRHEAVKKSVKQQLAKPHFIQGDYSIIAYDGAYNVHITFKNAKGECSVWGTPKATSPKDRRMPVVFNTPDCA